MRNRVTMNLWSPFPRRPRANRHTSPHGRTGPTAGAAELLRVRVVAGDVAGP